MAWDLSASTRTMYMIELNTFLYWGNFYIQCILQKLYTFLKKYDIKTLKVEFEIFKNLQSVNEFIKLTFEYHYTLFMIKKRFSVCHFKSFQNATCIIYF